MLALAPQQTSMQPSRYRPRPQPIASSSKLAPVETKPPTSSDVRWNVPDPMVELEFFSWPSLWFDVPSVSPQEDMHEVSRSHWNPPSDPNRVHDGFKDPLEKVPELVPSDSWSDLRTPESSPALCTTPVLLSHAPPNLIVSVAADVPLHAPRPRPLCPPPVLQFDFDKEPESEIVDALPGSSTTHTDRHSREIKDMPVEFAIVGQEWAASGWDGSGATSHNDLKRGSGGLDVDWTEADVRATGMLSSALESNPVSKRRRIDTSNSQRPPVRHPQSGLSAQRRPSNRIQMYSHLQPHTSRQYVHAQVAAQTGVPPRAMPSVSVLAEPFRSIPTYQHTLGHSHEWFSHSSGWF